MIPGKQYGPEDFLRIAWRRKWLIVVPFVVIGAATVAATSLLPNVYKSETLILVVPQRVPESYVQSTVTMRIEDRLQSISQQIMSRPRLERIIQELNLYAELRKTALMEDVVQRMREEIDPQIVRGDAFRITYFSGDPATAMRVVERLADLFIEENLRDREVLAEGTNQFLESQLEDARRRLVENEQRLAEYRLKHSDEMPSQLNANIQAQHNAEMQVQSLINALAIDRDRRRSLERQISDLALPLGTEAPAQPPHAVGTEEAGASSAERLAAAREQLTGLENRLTGEHPDVIRARRAVAELEQKVKDDAAAGPRATPARPEPLAERVRQSRLKELQADLESLTRDITAKEELERRLRSTIATYQQRVQAVPLRESELSALTRDYETINEMYQSLLQRHEASKISANLERRQQGEQFKVLEPANLPERPFSPNRFRLNLLGAFFGLAFGAAIAGGLEFLDKTIRSEEDVRVALGLPVLALVPRVAGDGGPAVARRWVPWSIAGAVVLALAAAVAGAALFMRA